MNSRFLHSLIALAVMASVAMAAPFDDLQAAFKTHRATANSQRDEQLAKFDASYSGALERQLEKVKSTGKLETAIPFNEEIKAVKKGQDPLPPLSPNATSELRNMRAKFMEGRDKILKDHAEVVVALIDKMEKELKAQEVALTKDGKLDEALAAKNMRDALTGDADTIAARELVKFSGQHGSGPPAYQLRRYGDNLEVLVFRDHRGKVSMDSPIEIVSPRPNAKKLIATTTAKVLGEFVGAKGYRADPWVAYHQVFDGKDLGKFALSEILSSFKQAEAGENGVRLSMKPAAINPYGYLADVLPPTSSKGTFRISCRYFIPRGNRAVNGFFFVQEVGGPLGGTIFDKTGKWETAQTTAESTHEKGAMLFYLCVPQAKKAIDAAGDSVVLGELKVEYLKYSAFVRQKFGDHGEPAEGSDEPKKQALFITNGQFIKE